MEELLFCLYLIGLLPILIARSWPARIVALFFGVVCIGLGLAHVWGFYRSADFTTTVDRVVLALAATLCIALVSAIVTYFVDKQYGKKG